MTIELLQPLEYNHTLLSTPEEIQKHLSDGVLDKQSAEHYVGKHNHFVEIVHRRGPASKALHNLLLRKDFSPDQRAEAEAAVATDPLVSLRLSGNLRNNGAGDWQALAMGGDVNNSYTGTATASSATSLTATGTPWTVNQWTHHVVWAAGNVFGFVLSNTSSVLTVDRWYTPGNSIGGGAPAAPAATAVFTIGGTAPIRFIALSNDATAPATTDAAVAGEITANGLGRAEGTFAHTAVSGGTTTTVTSTWTLAKLFTATGAQSAQKAAAFYSAVASTGVAMFENTFASVSMIATDTVNVTWTINC